MKAGRFHQLAAGIASASLPPLTPGEEIYDVRPPVSVPYPWLETIAWTGLGLLAVYAAYRLVVWLMTPVPEGELPPPPPPDPLEEALAALDRLRRSPIWTECRIKDICESLAVILKAYLRERFSLGIGPAATTSELLYDLRNEGVKPSIAHGVEELMNVCDGVKFAKGTLGTLTVDEVFTKIRELILRKDWRA